MSRQNTALVLFSGGQDSTVCLAYALTRYKRVETVGFDYGQIHKVEMQCRQDILTGLKQDFPAWVAKLGEDHILSLPVLAEIGGSALIEGGAIRMQDNGLPSSFVPGRNLLFLTSAAALAYRRGLDILVGGMCETDFSGYPDCRRAALDRLETALNQGMETDIVIETPLMARDKAAIWAFADELGGKALLDIIIKQSHTCYHGQRDRLYDWGYGCNACPACELRAKGYQQWQKARAPGTQAQKRETA
ncbi:MAG: 7-cyano-7-deazaguanine synthase QueC [Alphaproteobacteria bacterium]|nr:7-cyano-7-deazaguanine synthase QueC [Alphaproteobacteria bacterium]